ncbi:NAD(P)-dependent oxidoreductase [Rhizomicrobium electricum]|uniref:NAD(P)-dependent oxidoreductase n=1 Tax=Rhizomicrobium electricum TaxID=480070 RepID=A0ABN1ELH1_9PROT|nr:NAD(P)-dependent oxidoreductase [Rhizomicrobium electricum]NIJ47051.1 glutamate synthase (NADPH/NADH) small chain [Rhizomicrobium electricum]
MVEKMLKFVSLGRDMPGKRQPRERTRDFHEIYAEFAASKAAEQASRCSQCGVPFCQVHCPLSNNIPDWLKLTAEGRLEEAHEVSQATNNLPEICGRICPQDRLCEGSCVIEQSGHGTVTIGAVEKYINDTAWENGWVKPLQPARERDQSIGIIGAGPAGLACAEQLRKKGYKVTVYDRHDRAGGLMVYGIPGFKLEKHIVARRVKRLEDGGIVFKLNFEVGRDASLDKIRDKHDAVFIATGVYRAREIEVPGANLGAIVPALDFLIASNKKSFGDDVPDYDNGKLNADGKDVAVIGGGDTAMDCVRTALRQGAKSVSCLYRRDKDNMPGSLREVANAEEEGVKFEWLTLPKAFLGMENVEGVRIARQRLGAPDTSGRKSPEEIKGADFVQKADLVIKALGFDPEYLPMKFAAPRLTVSKWGTVRVRPSTMMTDIPGVFAGGDIVRGASLVVWAIRDGRDAAAAMHTWLQAQVRQAAE